MTGLDAACPQFLVCPAIVTPARMGLMKPSSNAGTYSPAAGCCRTRRWIYCFCDMSTSPPDIECAVSKEQLGRGMCFCSHLSVALLNNPVSLQTR